jgi:hypothetical protein
MISAAFMISLPLFGGKITGRTRSRLDLDQPKLNGATIPSMLVKHAWRRAE